MKSILVIGLSLLVTVAMVGCIDDDNDDDNGGGGGPAGSAAGSWGGSGQYVHNGVPITAFNLNLNQEGNSISGSYSIKRDARATMSGSVSGSVNGGNIDMTMSPHGYADGTFGGNTMTLDWFEAGFGGADFTGPRNGSVSLSR